MTTLLGMPSAKGLIHRAIVQSGGGGTQPSAEQSRDFSRQLIKELGNPDIAALQKMEWQDAVRRRQPVGERINGPFRFDMMAYEPRIR